MQTITKIILLLLLAFGFYIPVANAELITINLTATVNFVNDSANLLEGRITNGSIITGSYKYESTTQDSKPETWGGDYWHYTSPAGVFLAAGGFEFKTGDSIELNIFTRDNIPEDRYGFYSSKNLSLSNGSSVDSIWWSLQNPDGTVFSSDALPVTVPVLNQWQDNVLDIEGEQGGYHLQAEVTSAQLVPEPTTILLLTLGILGIRNII